MGNEFGEYMKARRLELDKTLREFCKEHALDACRVSRLERGVEPPTDYPELNYLRSHLKLDSDQWKVFKELAEKGRDEYVKPAVARVRIGSSGFVDAYNADGGWIEICSGFILRVAGELMKYCSEETLWVFNGCPEELDFSWWWREGHNASTRQE